MNNLQPSQRLVEQRVRNRIIEVLELTSSFEKQIEYQAGAAVHVPHEVINQWEDWYHPEIHHSYSSPVFSIEESEALAEFHSTFCAVCDKTPDPLPNLNATQELDAWRELRDAASAALRVFGIRGRFSEDIEETMG